MEDTISPCAKSQALPKIAILTCSPKDFIVQVRRTTTTQLKSFISLVEYFGKDETVSWESNGAGSTYLAFETTDNMLRYRGSSHPAGLSASPRNLISLCGLLSCSLGSVFSLISQPLSCPVPFQNRNQFLIQVSGILFLIGTFRDLHKTKN